MNVMTNPTSPSASPAIQAATWADFRAWAEINEKYGTLREIDKIPARLGMIDADAGLIPADLGHFERVIAHSSFATVSRSNDLKTARDRSNSRVNAALKRFLAAINPSHVQRGRADWDSLIDHVRRNSSTPGRGGIFNSSSYKPLTTLRARCPVAPQALTQDAIDTVLREASSEKRKSVRAGIKFLNDLVADRVSHPEIASLLPDVALATSAGSGRASSIAWTSLPEAFRASFDAAVKIANADPEMRVAEMRDRIAAGEDPVKLLAELDAGAADRGEVPGNPAVAEEQYRSSVTWLVRAAECLGMPREGLTDIRDVVTYRIIDQATQDQIARSRAAPDLKDPEKSQTLYNRLTGLKLLARYGLRSEELAQHAELVEKLNSTCVVPPGRDGMIEEIDTYCRQLQRTPSMAVALVNAPATLARKAEAALDEAWASKDVGRELSALRLYASAVMFAVQLSRPMRTSNLSRIRHRSCETAKGNLTWIKPGAHAELRFSPGEIKNVRSVTVHMVGGDAEILWRWMSDLRWRYLALRGIEDSVYIFPGEALPRLQKRGVDLPRGCLAPSSVDEIWDDGAAQIGIALHPHMARHSVATLILAMEPGNFKKCGSVLGIHADTVEKHYGRDSGAAAAMAVRKALLAQHSDIFNILKRRHPA